MSWVGDVSPTDFLLVINMPQALTKSQKIIFELLQNKGMNGVTPKQIFNEVELAPRTVRYALRKLLQMNLVRRIPCLNDMRQYLYMPSEQ